MSWPWHLNHRNIFGPQQLNFFFFEGGGGEVPPVPSPHGSPTWCGMLKVHLDVQCIFRCGPADWELWSEWCVLFLNDDNKWTVVRGMFRRKWSPLTPRMEFSPLQLAACLGRFAVSAYLWWPRIQRSPLLFFEMRLKPRIMKEKLKEFREGSWLRGISRLSFLLSRSWSRLIWCRWIVRGEILNLCLEFNA